jgi:hypothetical protein
VASIQVELNPFPVPTGVTVKMKPGRREDGFRPAPELKLTELSPVDLDAMCEEFRTAVFNAAGYNPLFNRPEAQAEAIRRSDDGRWPDVVPGGQEALNRR